MKKILAVLLALVMVVGLAACGGNSGSTTTSQAPASEAPASQAPASQAPADDNSGSGMADSITLWTYPIGKWGDEATVKELTDGFTAQTGIAVQVEYLSYTDGDDKVNAALSAGNAPDLVMEGPERLVANWGANGHMVDLSDIMDATDKSEINAVNEGVLKACTHTSGAVYEYPLVMTAHCMAINLTAFKEAGADQYVDLDSHTWTTEQFKNAVAALYAKYGDTVGAVFCSGQGGDQGTRALVNNMYGGTFTTSDHTKYTWDDAANIKALQELYEMDGIDFDASINGGEEIAKFYQGVLKMAFCWNIAQQLNPNGAGGDPEKTVTGDDIAFMSFPSETGKSELCGGIWGFGVFDSGDEGKIAAAKEFIKYMCDSAATVDAVKAASYFAVRSSAADGSVDLSNVWDGNDIMAEYTKLMPYLGDYYQVTTGWAAARTAWWTMLQAVGSGTPAADAVAQYVGEANAAT